LVSIITGFESGYHHAIAAALHSARVAARVRVDLVAIVACFPTLPDLPVTAASHHAGAQAEVGLDAVAIIAGFIAWLVRL
jgi:hypothetical protein